MSTFENLLNSIEDSRAKQQLTGKLKESLLLLLDMNDGGTSTCCATGTCS